MKLEKTSNSFNLFCHCVDTWERKELNTCELKEDAVAAEVVN